MATPDGDYAVVDLDYRVSQIVSTSEPPVLTSLAGASSNAPIDIIGPGDVLSLTIIQPDAGPLVIGQSASGAANELTERAAGTATPGLTVGNDGMIPVPYAGQVQVGGLTPIQAADAVRAALTGRVMDPQVLVMVQNNVANSVTLLGEVRAAGRYPLSANSDRLLDVIALAGGVIRPAADVELTIVRGNQSASTTMQAVMDRPAENIRLAPRDQLRLVYRPRKFSTFGALTQAAQMPIEDESLTLAGAISRMGGLNPRLADAESVLVFRFERPEVANALSVTTAPAPQGIPVIYRLNLRDPNGYFVANSFEIRSEDLIYVPQADTVELRSFFELVSSITRVAYDISVTDAIF